MALNLALNLAFMGPLQHMGPPLASAVAAWFNVGLLAWVLHRRGHIAADAALRRRLPRMLAAAAGDGGVLWAVQHTLFARAWPSRAMRWIALALLVTAGWRPMAWPGRCWADSICARRWAPATAPKARLACAAEG